MRSLYFLLILSATLLGTWSASLAATLHSIIVADTSDPESGVAAEVNLRNIEAFVNAIQENTALFPNQIILSERTWDYNTLKKVLNNLPVKPEDVVIFYYTGYGFNQKNSSRWPTLARSDEVTQSLKLEYVMSTLQAKAPRFLIILADVGNDFIKPNEGAIKGISSEKSENYRKLFLEFEGSLIATSAYPEQLAGNNAQGGYFTTAFLKVIEKNLAFSTSNWETIVGESRTLSFIVVDSTGQVRPQNPLIELNGLRKSLSLENIPLLTVKYDYRKKNEQRQISLTNESILSSEDTFKIHLTPSTNCQEKGCYVYIFEYDGHGNLEQLFPNNNVAAQNPIKTPLTLPSTDKSFKLDDKIGTETIHILAYQKPVIEEELRQRYEKKLATLFEKGIVNSNGLNENHISCEVGCVSRLTFKHEKQN